MIKTFIIVATTVDGFIGQNNEDPSTKWTSPADKKFFIERTKQAGAMVMGETTYQTIGKPLPGRLNIVYSFQAAELNTRKDPKLENLRFTDLPPEKLIAQLAQEGHQELAICGGTSIYTMFLKAGLVDTLYLTIEPKLFGQGVKLFNDKLDMDLELLDVKKLDQDVLVLTYSAKRKAKSEKDTI